MGALLNMPLSDRLSLRKPLNFILFYKTPSQVKRYIIRWSWSDFSSRLQRFLSNFLNFHFPIFAFGGIGRVFQVGIIYIYIYIGEEFTTNNNIVSPWPR